jgi:hypothetical protein
MRGKVFFANSNDGVKLSFTRLSLKNALKNINKKNPDNEFTIVAYIIVKKPKVVRDFIANSIIDNKIENSDLYYISDIEIKEIISYTRSFFNTKTNNKDYEDYDSDNKDFEDYDSEKDPEYIPSSDEVKSGEEDTDEVEEESNNEIVQDTVEESNNEIFHEEVLQEEVIHEEESNEVIIEEPTYKPKGKFFLVKEYLIIYSSAFILYNIFKFFFLKKNYTNFLNNNNYLSN